MIQIDIPMPEKCSDCIFCDDNCSCVASDYNGTGINVGCAYRTGRRDIRCPLKEQEAKPPIHVHEEYPKHDWETDEDGKIDEWAMSYEFHNGPVCKRCYHSFCIHCEPNGFNDGPCVIDEYKCPRCGCVLQKGTKFCSECGQEVKWE